MRKPKKPEEKNIWPEWMTVERLVPPPKNRGPSPAQVRAARTILFQAGGRSELAAIRLFAGEAGWKRLRAYFLADAKEGDRVPVAKEPYRPRDTYNRVLDEMRKRANDGRRKGGRLK